ncbi:MAG: EAL domain-containing protein [Gallionellaceae bacterium]|nr:MAG: EAL domain-containing protein [Gallionellaceae bacterium]
MERENILPILYDLAVTIGGEISLKPLLTRTLQRLLYYTSYPAGFICLDVPACHGDSEVSARIDAAVGDYDLVGQTGRRIMLPCSLLCGTAARETGKAELLSTLTNTHIRYKTFLRLPIDGSGVIVLLAPETPATEQPLTQIFQPVLAHLDKAITLCRSNDAYTSGLISERNLLAEVYASSYSGVLITDADGKIIEVNPAFTRITGYPLDEVRGKNPHVLSSGQHDHFFFQEMWDDIENNGHWQGEIWNRRKNGEIFPEWLSINPVRDKNGQPTNYVGMFSDISQRKEAEAKIHQLAFYDPLTQLPNRRLLLAHLPQTFSASVRTGSYGAVMLFDIDHFKTLNDTKGHEVGDLLLVEVAKRLNACIRNGDMVVRLGGDEFIVVLETLSPNPAEAATKAGQIAEKMRDALNQPFALQEYTHFTTPSIGVVLFRGHQDTVDNLLKYADTAMYQAKTSGRNAIRFYDPAMQAAIEARADLEGALRQALKQDQFRLHYQIQMDSLRRPTGAEVLLRWEHPGRGLVSPLQFIPLAEETGLIVPIGLWVLKVACTQLKKWQDDVALRNLSLAVNVSAKQLRQADFVAQVQRTLQETGARPACLKLELTESTVLENVDDTIAKMRELKLHGVSFSMDDFGTGYSSLQYLKRLPLDQLKIDQSFVRDLATDPNDAAIVQAIIAMSQALGLNVIAEGVETETQREFLDQHGCHNFQGYLFGKPLPLAQFEQLAQQAK